eukprot:CAMPEP_0168171066 /NCGR_PEP_ID=MMETSP0139_2-20121125/4510_1 /TAXON_ID=44445 /ORGANISM="Pseudo-nitzschia australis, Strain 10249 10 AB" /LENGTH=82 /DNA_ID=CAMNT_0008088601 /DNA_START=1478 /DNA_END=1726 /DNA_ORIENTATION=-
MTHVIRDSAVFRGVDDAERFSLVTLFQGLIGIDVRVLLIQFQPRQEFVGGCLHFLAGANDLIHTNLDVKGHSETGGPPTDRD